MTLTAQLTTLLSESSSRSLIRSNVRRSPWGYLMNSLYLFGDRRSEVRTGLDQPDSYWVDQHFGG